MATVLELKESIVRGAMEKRNPEDKKKFPVALRLTQELLAQGEKPETLLREGMIAAMSLVGEKYARNEMFVPEMLVAARAMSASMELLKPCLVAQGVQPIGKVVIGTVKGDQHDIGKNLVRTMFEGAGFEVTDAGVNVSEEKFCEEVARVKPQILALSALLTTTMPAMKIVIDALVAKGLRQTVKILVGGAPVTAEYGRQIGADAYGMDASDAVVQAKTVLGLS